MPRLVSRASTAVQRFTQRAILPRLRDPSWRGLAAAVVATLGLLVFMVRVIGAGWPERFTIFFPDSFSFKRAAKLTPFSFGFYAAERPIAFPTLLFLLGRSTVVTVVVQTFLYGVVYLFAGWTCFRLLQRREAAIVCGFLILTIGLEPRFAMWNSHILSESLGMTLAVLSVTLWWRFSADPSSRRLNLAGIATIGWLTVRDSNVPNWMAVGVPALLIGSFIWRSAPRRLKRGLRVWGAVLAVVCVGVALTQSANGRNRYATMNNVGTRVLFHDDITNWFEDQGMPVDDALLARKGNNSFDNSWDMLLAGDLQDFRDWADSSGQRTMLISYFRFLPTWLDQLDRDLPNLLDNDLRGYDAFGVQDRLPDAAPAQINGPTTRRGLLVWTILSVVSLAGAAWQRRDRRLQSLVLGLLLASSFVDLYMAYIGDSVEVQRHMVGPLSRQALIMVIALGLGLDAAIAAVASAWARRRGVQRAGDADGDAPDAGDSETDAPVASAADELVEVS